VVVLTCNGFLTLVPALSRVLRKMACSYAKTSFVQSDHHGSMIFHVSFNLFEIK